MNKKQKIIMTICVAVLTFLFVRYFVFIDVNNINAESKRFNSPRHEMQSKWIRLMEQKNPDLHEAIISAMLISKDLNREIFVLKTKNNTEKYRLANEQGGSNNLFSYNYKNNWFSFDHYNKNDGPLLGDAENELFARRSINRAYKELNIK